MDILYKTLKGVLFLDEEGTIVKLDTLEETSSDVFSEGFIHKSIFDVLRRGRRIQTEVRKKGP